MEEPTRVHDQDQSIIPTSHLDLLTSTALANVATIGPDGAPQVNPVWFDWDGTNLRFGQITTRQKVRNLRRDPRLAVSIVDPANPARYLEIRGVARLVPDSEAELTDRLAKKYLGLDRFPYAQPGRSGSRSSSSLAASPTSEVMQPLRRQGGEAGH
jgi:PPOX class probable F420-dependent enzyme